MLCPALVKKIKLFVLLFLVILSTCSMAQILGLSREEAKKKLEKGDIDFILETQFPDSISESLSLLRPVTRINSRADFYTALLAETAEAAEPGKYENFGNVKKSTLFFILALENKSGIIRREAGIKLMLPVLEGPVDLAREILNLLDRRKENDNAVLRKACLFRLGRFNEIPINPENSGSGSSWEKVMEILSPQNNSALHDSAVLYLFTAPVEPPWIWLLNEITESRPDLFDTAETALISARLAVSGSQFSRSLDFFLPALDPENPDYSGSGLFLEYPELTRDLGRAFQFSPDTGEAGIELFSSWEEEAEIKNASTASKYLLSYFLGRISRQRGEFGKSSEAFARALKIAPDTLQADACIWYILMNALDENPETADSQFILYIPAMHSLDYFDDVLDRLCRYLTSQKNWKTLEDIFILLGEQGERGNAYAQYAWILGRAAEEKFYVPGKTEDYFRIIYDDENSSFYYRTLSASRLGLNLIPEKTSGREAGKKPASEIEFLLAFADFAAGAQILPYIKNYEDSLGIPDLRLLAAALAKAGLTNESMNLVSRYMNRAGFEPGREDLYLFYPRPFQEMIEHYAARTGVRPELLFALIRTESYFMPGALSRSGARGLCQIMTPTALDMAGRIARQRDEAGIPGPDYRTADGIDLENPEISIHIGSFYLNYLMENMNSPMNALLAYNGGMGRVRRWRAAEPLLPEDLFLETIEFTETREYGRRVLSAAAVYGYLYYGLHMDKVITDILFNE